MPHDSYKHEASTDVSIAEKYWEYLIDFCTKLAGKKLQNQYKAQAEDVAMTVVFRFLKACQEDRIAITRYIPEKDDYELINMKGETRNLKAYLGRSVENAVKDIFKSAPNRLETKIESKRSTHFAVESEPNLADLSLEELPETRVNANSEDVVMAQIVGNDGYQVLETLEQFRTTLSPSEQQILQNYIRVLLEQQNEDFSTYGLAPKVAEKLAMTSNNVTVTMNKIRRKLKDWLANKSVEEVDMLPDPFYDLWLVEARKTRSVTENTAKVRVSKKTSEANNG